MIDLANVQDPQAAYENAQEEMVAWAERVVQGMPERMELDEAGPWLQKLLYWANLHEDGHHLSRFLAGEATRRVLENTPHGQKMETWERMRQFFGFGGTRTLRYCAAFSTTFHGNVKLFVRWLSTGRQKHWGDLVEASRLDQDPSVLGVEAFDDLILNRLEGGAEAMERTNDALEAMNAPEDDPRRLQFEAAQLALTEEAVRYRQLGRKALMDPDVDQTNAALEAFENMLRNMNCMACGRPPQDNPDDHTHPHHVAPSATAQKRFDWLRVPLCWKHHTLLHSEGHAAFKAETNCDIRALSARTLHIWETGEDPVFPTGLD